MYRTCKGFTLIELMITLVVASIGVALAVPAWNEFTEKRQVTAAAEEVASFIEFARQEAVKSNDKVFVQWYSPGGHNANWCVGLSAEPQSTPCDCTVTNTASADFCSIDGVPYRLTQTDFVSVGFEFLHMNPASSSFSFDPVRGIVTDVVNAESVDGDWFMRLHSNEGSGSSRLWALEISLNVTGRTSICADENRKRRIGGYAAC